MPSTHNVGGGLQRADTLSSRLEELPGRQVWNHFEKPAPTSLRVDEPQLTSSICICGLAQVIDSRATSASDADCDPECHPETSYSTGPAGGEGWVGWYHTCVQNQGPIFVWRDGKLVERGYYVNGKRGGLFTTYALDGSVIKRSRYVAGNEVPLEDD